MDKPSTFQAIEDTVKAFIELLKKRHTQDDYTLAN